MKTRRTTHLSTLFFLGLFSLQACTPPQQAEVDTVRTAPAPAEKTKYASTVMEEALADAEVDETAAQPLAAPLAQKKEMNLGYAHPTKSRRAVDKGMDGTMIAAGGHMQLMQSAIYPPPPPQQPQFNVESYTPHKENSFILTKNDPLSTFSIDVDTGSYANIRRFLTGGNMVPVGAVRIEEMLNYFHYDYKEPSSSPLGITTELGPCPWQPEHSIARIGIKGKDLDTNKIPPSNLVFLVDVSGSMNQVNKLPLVKKSLQLLTKELTATDRISMVVYAGSNRVVLPPTPGDQTEVIVKAIEDLRSGGSTHGSAGILSAYQLAHQGFIPGGNNRVILASDGDFNVGVTSRGELEKLIEKERKKGVYLTVLGFGGGNYKDDTMELLADKGNGNYSYIDSLLEAKKVLVKERASTLYTIAKDVKLQIEFNPAHVGAYRLIGYENRALADEDFRDDKKDAGEVGAGHRVTALYELIPPGGKELPDVRELKYLKTSPGTSNGDEVLTVNLRYKDPDNSKSKLLSQPLMVSDKHLEQTSNDFRFGSAVAWFGMVLKKSEHLPKVDYKGLITLARNSRGNDDEGLRAEFIKLVETAELLEQ